MTDMKETISLEEFRENAEEILATLGKRIGPLVLSVDGKRMAVMIEYEHFQYQEGLALAKILEMRREDSRRGKSRSAKEVFEELRAELRVE